MKTEPIEPPLITYEIADGKEVHNISDLVRFLDECTAALFNVLINDDWDMEVVANFLRQMLIEQAAKYQIRRPGRPRGAKTVNPAEKILPSSLARRKRRERAEARVYDEFLVRRLEQHQK